MFLLVFMPALMKFQSTFAVPILPCHGGDWMAFMNSKFQAFQPLSMITS